MSSSAVVGLGVAAASSAMLGVPVLTVLRRHGIVDVPGPRSSHAVATPRGGGAAVLLAMLVGLAATTARGAPALALALAAVVLGVLGLADDLRRMSPLTRLALQAALAVIPLPWLLQDLSGALAWKACFTVGVWIWLVAYVNACNFMDGINGLALAQAVIAGATWWVLGADSGSRALEAGGAVLAGAALGFAPYNFPRARMFLGDVGSYAIGAWMAVATVIGLRAGVSPLGVLAPLALFLSDTATTVLVRIRRRERWYEAHRSHTYQRLVIAGWSHTATTAFAAGVMVTTSLLGVLGSDASPVGTTLATLAILAILVGYLVSPRIVGRLALRGGTS